MEDRSLFSERQKMFTNAFNMKPNIRTPIFSNIWTWKILDSGYQLSEALLNYDVMEKIVSQFQERYQFDAHFDLGLRNSTRVTDALGTGYHVINDKEGSVEVLDHKLMEGDEYFEYAKDPNAFYWTKAFARYCPKDITIGQLCKAVEEQNKYIEFAVKITVKFIQQYQCMAAPGFYLKLPFEYFFNDLRGIKESAIDARKHKDGLIAASETIYNKYMFPGMKAAFAADDSANVGTMYTALLGHSVLSIRQFEEVYWPWFKNSIDEFIKNKKTLLVQCESTFMRFAEFLQDVPKGILMYQLEQDDIFEMRKKLPNICFSGGMPPHLLRYGTKQECIDYAKKLIDEMGEGYVFSQTKMISFKNDCKRENLEAANDFVRNYRH